MKKSILFGIALLSLGVLSCTRETEAPQARMDRNVVTLGATVAPTKAAIDADGKFTWQASDVLAVQVVNEDETPAGFASFELVSGAGSDAANFSAVLPKGQNVGAWAVYPNASPVVSESTLTVNLPAEYVYEESNTNIPLLGAVADGKVAMRYIGGVVRFPVNKMPAEAAAVKLVADKMVTGEFALDLTDAAAVLKAGEGESSITYTFSKVEDLMVFNFPLPEGTYNLKLQLLNAEGVPVYEKVGQAPSEIKAGSVLVYNELYAEVQSAVILNGEDRFASFAEAIAAIPEKVDAGKTATLAMTGDMTEDIFIAGKFAAGEGCTAREIGADEFYIESPVVIDGAGHTLNGSIEILTAPVTVKDLTIMPTGHTPVYAASRNSQAFGVWVHYAKYGVVLDKVVIDLANSLDSATGLFMFNGVASADDDGPTRDIIRGCSIIGKEAAGNRLVQFYQSKADFIGNVFKNAYSKYAIRIDGWGANILLDNNVFESKIGTDHVFDFQDNLSHGQIVLGDGEADNNVYNGFAKWGQATFDITTGASMAFQPELEYLEGGEVRIKEQAVTRIWKKNQDEIPLGDNGFKGGQVAFSGLDFVLCDKNVYDLDGKKVGVLNVEGIPENGAIEGMSNSYDGYLVVSFAWNNVTHAVPVGHDQAFAYATYVWFDGWQNAPTLIWGDPAGTATDTSGNSGYGLAVSGYMAQGGTWVLATNQAGTWNDNDYGRNCHTIVWENYDHAKPHMNDKPAGSWAWNQIPYKRQYGDYTCMMQSVTGTADGKWVYYSSIGDGPYADGTGNIIVGVREGRKSGAGCGDADIRLYGTGQTMHPWYPAKYWGNLNCGHVRGFLLEGAEYVVVSSCTWIGGAITVMACDDTENYLMKSRLYGAPESAVSAATVEDNGTIHIIARAAHNGQGEIRRYDIKGRPAVGGNVEGPDVTVTPDVEF